ncbi:hypothetical protein P4O66_017130 [Electrophorus voltai]|uniref:Uncharacterized protein n=1 Tax=Electrophorus voltai TaxID=2609070 RepID=A0AAD8YW12_9TELE|nr:hypothetical protein P4O66_017130 [Electrophorus voltai]
MIGRTENLRTSAQINTYALAGRSAGFPQLNARRDNDLSRAGLDGGRGVAHRGWKSSSTRLRITTDGWMDGRTVLPVENSAKPEELSSMSPISAITDNYCDQPTCADVKKSDTATVWSSYVGVK